MKKKILLTLAAIVIAIGIFAGCAGEKNIVVLSREAGSGTRSAFEEFLGLESDEVKYSLVMDKTNNVMQEVANNKNAIGYVSLSSVNDTVKTLQIGGIDATEENIISGKYTMSRPFELVTKKGTELSPVAKDFLSYALSSTAQDVIIKSNVSINGGNEPYTAPQTALSGKLKVSGSTSVEPLFEKLFGEYKKLNPGVDLEMTASGSGSGIADAGKGTVDIGMSSRNIKASELETLDVHHLCLDGIAVIVNKSNALGNVTVANLTKIYTGEILKFSLVK